MTNLIEKYKTIALKKRNPPWNSPTSFALYFSFLYICFEGYQKAKSILLGDWLLVKGFIFSLKIQNHIYKKARKTLELSKTLSLYIAASYKFAWKSAKG